MPIPSPHPQAKWWIALGSLGLGAISAVFLGVGFEDSATAEVNRPGVVITAGTYFNPASALVGFLIGGVAGALIGTFWYRAKPGPAAAAVLLTAFGGLAGFVVAALLGRQTTVEVSGNYSMSESRVPPEVLLLGGGARRGGGRAGRLGHSAFDAAAAREYRGDGRTRRCT